MSFAGEEIVVTNLQTAVARPFTETSKVIDWPPPAKAWLLVVLLTAAYAAAILDRVVLGLLVQPIQAELKLTNTEIGLLQGVAFGVCFSLLGYPIGLMVDRFERRRIVAVGILTWSAATAIGGAARGFPDLFASRMAVGIGEASLSPAASSLIADCFPVEKRSRAYAVYTTGTALGTGLAFLFGATALIWADQLRAALPTIFGDVSNWRIVFLLTGLPGLFVGLLMLLLLREPARRERKAAPGSNDELWRFLRANSMALGMLTLGVAIKLIGNYAMLAWFPTLFVKTHGWTMAEAAAAIGFTALPIGVFGALSSGGLIMRLERRGRVDAPIVLAMVASIGYAFSAIFACIAPSPQLAVAGYGMMALFANWPTAAAIIGLNRITPNELRGRVAALYSLVIGIVSLGAGPVAVGLLTDYVFGPQGLVRSLLAVLFGCLVLGMAVLNAGRPAYRRSCAAARAWSSAG